MLLFTVLLIASSLVWLYCYSIFGKCYRWFICTVFRKLIHPFIPSRLSVFLLLFHNLLISHRLRILSLLNWAYLLWLRWSITWCSSIRDFSLWCLTREQTTVNSISTIIEAIISVLSSGNISFVISVINFSSILVVSWWWTWICIYFLKWENILVLAGSYINYSLLFLAHA